MAVLTALEHRDQTGEGSFVDISQFETTVSSLGPFLLDHELSGPRAASARATGWPGWPRRARTRASGRTRGWRSRSTTTRRGPAWPESSVGRQATRGSPRSPAASSTTTRSTSSSRRGRRTARPTTPRSRCRRRGRGVRGVRHRRLAARPADPGPALVPGAWIDPVPGRRPVQRPPDPPRRRAGSVVAGRAVDGRGHPGGPDVRGRDVVGRGRRADRHRRGVRGRRARAEAAPAVPQRAGRHEIAVTVEEPA